ncbi:MAG: restriction endonuclease subunit S [Dehalobacter sp.]|nr:restriction endonuclease subunit S [Dehalobacter sp.]
MPKQWPQVALGEILTERNETPDPALVRAGDIPIISKIRFSDGGIELRTDSDTNTKMILIHPGDLVLSGINAMKGAIAIYDPGSSQKVAATIHYAAYQVNKEKADIRYLWWLLRSQYFQDILSQQVPQGIKTELKAKRLLPVLIPLPSISEQHRIVNLITQMAQKVLCVLELQEKAYLETSKLVRAKSMNIFEQLLAQYSSISVDQVISFRNDLLRPSDKKSGKAVFIGLQHIESETGLRSGEELVNIETLNGRKFRFYPGDVIYGYLRPYLNKVWIADREGLCSVDQYVLIPKLNIIDTEFLAIFLRSPVFVEQAINLTHSLMLPRLRSGLFGKIEIPIPPIDIQKQIVKQLNEFKIRLDQCSNLQKKCIYETHALLYAYVDKIHKGKYL